MSLWRRMFHVPRCGYTASSRSRSGVWRSILGVYGNQEQSQGVRGVSTSYEPAPARGVDAWATETESDSVGGRAQEGLPWLACCADLFALWVREPAWAVVVF